MSSEEDVFPVHWVSKEARYRIIELMLSTRSITELARVLGISPTAVRKYVKRESHPSDEILSRAIKSAETYERASIIEIIIDDLVDALSRLYRSVDENHKKMIIERVTRALGIGAST